MSSAVPLATDLAFSVPCYLHVTVLLRALCAHVGLEAASSLACLHCMVTGCRRPDVVQQVNSVYLFSAYPLTAEFASATTSSTAMTAVASKASSQ